jgi:hypothetical protein
VAVREGRVLRSARALVLSDAHLLGQRRRSALDRWWTDRQLSRVAWGARLWHRPHVVVSLGDVVDEGLPMAPGTWRDQVVRLRGALGLGDPEASTEAPQARAQAALEALRTQPLHVLGTVGNHDARDMTRVTVDAFQRSFGASNDVVRLEQAGIELVLVNGIALDRCHGLGALTMEVESEDPLCVEVDSFLQDLEHAARHRRADGAGQRAGQPQHGLVQEQEQGQSPVGAVRVLLLHMPLYRANDLDCQGARPQDESGGVTFKAAGEKLVVGADVLSAPISERLLRAARPDLVLSGHTHAGCVTAHPLGFGQRTVTEATVSTFSWRMRPDPSYAVVDFDAEAGELEVRFCRVPHEHAVIVCYVVSGLGAALAALAVLLVRGAEAGAVTSPARLKRESSLGSAPLDRPASPLGPARRRNFV